MKTIRNTILAGLLCLAATVHAETIDTRIGKLSFTHDFASGYPTRERSKP